MRNEDGNKLIRDLLRRNFPCGSQLVKNPPAIQGTWVQSLGWERSPGEGKGYPLQYSGVENSMDCIVHGVAKSRTLSDFHFSIFWRGWRLCPNDQSPIKPLETQALVRLPWWLHAGCHISLLQKWALSTPPLGEDNQKLCMWKAPAFYPLHLFPWLILICILWLQKPLLYSC